MRYRKQSLYGKTFRVPSHVVRLESHDTHGWQLRYGPSKFFADPTSGRAGAGESLRLATAELASRIARLPAPTGLRIEPNANKTSELPVGVSGPKEVRRTSRPHIVQYYFQVSVPVPGGRSTNKQVYIATQNTITPDKMNTALAKALAIRDSHVRKYKVASTKRKREQAVLAGLKPDQ